MSQKYNIREMIDHSEGWNWEENHVSQSYISNSQNDQNIAITDIVESGTVLIAAGPADLNKAVSTAGADGSVRIVPIGLIESAQIQMSKPLSRIFEIGSKLSYVIPGRTVGGMGLSRVFFDGPSLLKALYFGEVKSDYADENFKYAKFISSQYLDENSEEAYQQFQHIGSGNMAMNLASSFFDHPVGLGFYFRDQQNDEVAQIYFEGCNSSSYNIGISANMNVLTEMVNMEFIRCRPIVTVATNEYKKGKNVADVNIVSDMSNTGDS